MSYCIHVCMYNVCLFVCFIGWGFLGLLSPHILFASLLYTYMYMYIVCLTHVKVSVSLFGHSLEMKVRSSTQPLQVTRERREGGRGEGGREGGRGERRERGERGRKEKRGM